jgi:DNA-binding transcriptional LysR family regulator
MSIEDIDVFVEVIDAQSFARAAERLRMPTTTVSAKIARLERFLGVTLIRRTTRQLHITPAGEIFYQRCVRAMAELDQGKRELDAGKQEPVGVLRITAPNDIAQSLLTPIIGRFIELYPKASVELRITSRVVDLISERVDLAVRIGLLDDSRMIIRKFRTVGGGLWASPAYLARKGTPKHAAELCDHDFVRFAPMPETLVVRSSAGDPVELKPNWRLASDDMENLRSLIICGYGLGFLPQHVAESTVPVAFSLVRVLPDYVFPCRDINFVYPSQAFVPQPVRAFIALATGAETRRGVGDADVADKEAACQA